MSLSKNRGLWREYVVNAEFASVENSVLLNITWLFQLSMTKVSAMKQAQIVMCTLTSRYEMNGDIEGEIKVMIGNTKEPHKNYLFPYISRNRVFIHLMITTS